MTVFFLSDEGSVIHKPTGLKYQVFIGQEKLWFICAKERDLLNALYNIKHLAKSNYKKVTEILSKYHVYWAGNATVLSSTNITFRGFNRYDTKDICKSYCED